MHMFEFWNRMITYFSHHVMLNAWAHSLGGFGLAVILQYYLKGNSFVPVWFGWGLIAISVVIHILAFMG